MSHQDLDPDVLAADCATAAEQAAKQAAEQAQLAYELARVVQLEATRAVNEAIRNMKAHLLTLPPDTPQAKYLRKWIRKLEQNSAVQKVLVA
ncbi:MAG: hypothetical protein WCI67_23530 [Chloroflexales bacterium]